MAGVLRRCLTRCGNGCRSGRRLRAGLLLRRQLLLLSSSSSSSSTACRSMSTRISLLHFNDCYNVEPNAEEPVAGAARFKTALKSFAADQPLVLFSGDIMAPSIISTFTRGEHMIPVLDQCEVACAVFGNHEFEYGVDHLVSFASRTAFPWLLSNLTDSRTGRPMGQGKEFHVMQHQGKTLGLVGLVEQEWLSTLGVLSRPEDQLYQDFVTQAQKYAHLLKHEHGVDFVIALTHMRWPNDCKLVTSVSDVDLVLGGHDHEYGVKLVDGRYIVKSGSDFRSFSKIDIVWQAGQEKPEVTVHKVEVTSAFAEDPELKEILNQYTQVMESKMDIELARFSVDLDCRFAVIRTQETLIGNLLCDILRQQNNADIAIINSGTFRSDRVHAAVNTFTYRDLVTLQPKVSPVVVLQATGGQVHAALENGVSQFPRLEGRFPQVSGLSFSFDPEKEAFARILPSDVRVAGQPLDLHKEYKLVTKGFLAAGRDGYNVLTQCPVLVNEDHCHPPPPCLERYFDQVRGTVICPKLEKRIVNLRNNS